MYNAANFREARATRMASADGAGGPRKAPCRWRTVDLRDPKGLSTAETAEISGIKTVSFLPKRFLRQRRRKKPPTQWLARILTK